MDSEQETIHHFSHDHPLVWIPKLVRENEWTNYCRGCCRYFSSGEAVYCCINNSCGYYLHQDCAGMPRHIRHRTVHPPHLLTQSRPYKTGGSSCAICEDGTYGLIYKCSEGCDKIWIHLGCAEGSDAADEPAINVVKLQHPSHPRHELTLVMREKRLCSFQCDACGTVEKGNSYSCNICNYWIHESCANLPATADFPRHHDHSLSLSFYPPYEYVTYEFACGVCNGVLGLRRWVYHCHLCGYVVHVKCATNTTPASTEISDGSRDDDHIKGPIEDMYEEIIKPFVKKMRCGDIEKEKEMMSGKHDHPLSFTKFSSHDHNEEDDDDDGESPISKLTCDGCTLPIHQKNEKAAAGSSRSCSYEYEYDDGYMSCGECKYFLHLACFNLPPELSSIPIHDFKDHKLALRKSNNLFSQSCCSTCEKSTNGLLYKCAETKCSFRVDIKCAFLPVTIKHAGHSQPCHYLKLVFGNDWQSWCSACRFFFYGGDGSYSCDCCRFTLCLGCVLLPASNQHRLEKHRLPLTYDARVNHPSEFYCGSCEQKMHPKRWMYHCRDCDESFHPECCTTTSGKYRNTNFGSQHYNMKVTTLYHHPHHPLRYQPITKKERCDLCRKHVYEQSGFQCTMCNFVTCLHLCGKEHLDLTIDD